MNTKRRFVNIGELADMLNVRVHTIYVWVSQHKIPYRKFGKALRFDPEAVLQYFADKQSTEKLKGYSHEL